MPGHMTFAEAKAAGKTHLEIVCGDCSRKVLIPWALLDGRLGTQQVLRDFARRMSCQTCGGRPDPAKVKAWERKDDDLEGFDPFKR